MTVKELYHVKYTEVSKVKVWLVQNIEDRTVRGLIRPKRPDFGILKCKVF